MPVKRFIDQVPITMTDDGTLAVLNPDGTTIGGGGGASGGLTDVQLRATPVPVGGPLTDAQLRAVAVAVLGPLTDAQLRATPIPISGTFWQAIQPVSGTLTTNQGTPAAAPWPVEDRRYNSLTVTATGAAAAAVTANLPAVAGQFHYIESIEITAYSTAARTGTATPITVTTTNLRGLAWTFATAAAIGSRDSVFLQPTHPIQSQAVGTATTIVCPGTTGVIWRVTVHYWTGN